MEERWHIFFRDPWLHFVRSWTGFCTYKVRLKKRGEGYRVAVVWANRDKCQYGVTDPQADVEMLCSLIDHLLVGCLYCLVRLDCYDYFIYGYGKLLGCSIICVSSPFNRNPFAFRLEGRPEFKAIGRKHQLFSGTIAMTHLLIASPSLAR